MRAEGGPTGADLVSPEALQRLLTRALAVELRRQAAEQRGDIDGEIAALLELADLRRASRVTFWQECRSWADGLRARGDPHVTEHEIELRAILTRAAEAPTPERARDRRPAGSVCSGTRACGIVAPVWSPRAVDDGAVEAAARAVGRD